MEDADRLAIACQRAGVDYHIFDADSVAELDMPVNRPVMFYVDAALCREIWKAQRWQPGVVYDPSQFVYTRYIEQYGARVLNYQCAVKTVRELAASTDYDLDHRLMIRPNSDSKQLTGAVWKFGDFQQMAQATVEAGIEEAATLELVVCEPVEIDREWRLIILEGRVSCGSLYEEWGDQRFDPNIPQRVVQFAEETAAVWSPLPLFVMDICECDGELRVVELNGFNSCGLYGTDMTKLITDVNAWMMTSAEQ
jgi:hypothetical protein